MRDIILFFSILKILIAEDPTDMDSFITGSGEMGSFSGIGERPSYDPAMTATTASTTSTKSKSNSTTTNTDTTTYTIENHRSKLILNNIFMRDNYIF